MLRQALLVPLLFACFAAVPLARADPLAATAPSQVLMVSNGYDALLLRVALIRQAQSSIAIQTFIWTNDECGRLLVWELMEASRRGVKVRIIADQLASDKDPDTIAFLASVHPNFEVKHYRPQLSRLKPAFWQTIFASVTSFRALNQRMHNKVMVVDDRYLLTGGRNIENTYYDHSTELNFRDRDILATGPAVQAAAASFEQFWRYRHAVASRELVDVAAALQRGTFRRFDRREDFNFGPHFADLERDLAAENSLARRFPTLLRPVTRATFVADEPGKTGGYFSRAGWSARSLREALEGARQSVVVQTPYLVLSRPARRLFRDLRERQVRIQISTNSFSSTDNLMAYSANYRLRNDYIRDLNLDIFEFKPLPATLERLFPRHGRMTEIAAAQPDSGRRPPFLCVHAKSLVIDDRIAFIGSYNLDPRSENLNTEVGLLIEDETIARELRAEIEADMRPENAWVIARRRYPLGLGTVNSLIDGIVSLTPLDVWPLQNTSSFELRPGQAPVPPDDPAFHDCYEDVGPFPGTDGILSPKEITTRLYKAVGAALTPII